MSKKNNSLQEYLARGGKITVCPTKPMQESERRPVRSTVVSNVVNILTYEEADQLYGIKIERKKTEKTINPKTSKKMEELRKNIDKLPKHIKDKLNL